MWHPGRSHRPGRFRFKIWTVGSALRIRRPTAPRLSKDVDRQHRALTTGPRARRLPPQLQPQCAKPNSHPSIPANVAGEGMHEPFSMTCTCQGVRRHEQTQASTTAPIQGSCCVRYGAIHISIRVVECCLPLVKTRAGKELPCHQVPCPARPGEAHAAAVANKVRGSLWPYAHFLIVAVGKALQANSPPRVTDT